jgi:hypothetical protein
MAADLQLTPRQQWRFAEFRRRLEYVGESYRYWKDAENDRPTFNQSLKVLQRALKSPNRKRRKLIRLHPLVEIGISMLASNNSKDPADEFNPSPDEIETAVRELLRRTTAIRGRPSNLTLRYHVKALMLLCEWTTGVPVTASPLTNSVYEPQMTSDGAKAIEMAFKRIDPSVTRTTLMNIVRQTRGRRELEGKRFDDFFPLYQSEPHPELAVAAPSQIEVRFAHPIYCS